MCGFVGLLKNRICDSDIHYLREMSRSIKHRGPDSSGLWSDNTNIGISHQRLSIIDLTPSGYQPMISKSGRYVLAFNGEIYNHRFIKRELNSAFMNIEWKGTSDTEILLTAIDKWGLYKSLNKITGMFAFSLWDKKEKLLYLARDRIGEKPIYYGWQKDTFLFGSDIQGIKSHPSFENKIDSNSLSLMLRFNYVPSPNSIYKNLKKLEPGSFLQVSIVKRDIQKKNYWSAAKTANNNLSNLFSGSELEAIELLDINLSETVKNQMLSDAPIGGFLSGGIDSSIICSLMQKNSIEPINTFSIGFNEKTYDEAQYAKLISDYLGTNHHELYLSPQDAMKIIPELQMAYSEPFADVSQIPTMIISDLAKDYVKVALTGDGGDELFGGYNRYLITKRIWKKISMFGKPIRSFIANFILSYGIRTIMKIEKLNFSEKYINNFSAKISKGLEVLDSDDIFDLYINITSNSRNPSKVLLGNSSKEKLYGVEKLNLQNFSDVEKMMIMDIVNYLPDDILVKLDRATMHYSIEARAPFLDHNIFEFAWSLPLNFKLNNSENKVVLRRLLSKYLPNELIHKPKRGFSVPIGIWLRGPLKNWAEHQLNQKRLNDEGFFNPKVILNLWKEHLEERFNHEKLLWSILMFQSWLEVNR